MADAVDEQGDVVGILQQAHLLQMHPLANLGLYKWYQCAGCTTHVQHM